MTASQLDLMVYQEGRHRVPGELLAQGLAAELRQAAACVSGARSAENGGGIEDARRHLLNALLRCGEIECGLADAGAAADDQQACAKLTDALAEALVASTSIPTRGIASGSREASTADAAQLPGWRHIDTRVRFALPETLLVTHPEGFSYYALHPLQYADLAQQLLRSGTLAADPITVAGIRTIGSALSAVVAAALRLKGVPASRLTVRPGGPPFDRECELDEDQRALVQRTTLGMVQPDRDIKASGDDLRASSGARFVVVDEGPGISGSSFLSVGDALVRSGAAPEQIVFMTSHAVDPAQLAARDGERRWRRFRSFAVGRRGLPPSPSAIDLSGGLWRQHLYSGNGGEKEGSRGKYPPSWTSRERHKFLTIDGRLLKFEGLGRYGDECLARARTLAVAGFGPAVSRTQGPDGYFEYQWIAGAPARRGDLNAKALRRMAEYCAFRARELAAPPEQVPAAISALLQMTRHNHQREFGAELAPAFALQVARPVIADARMMPHEWLRPDGGDGEWLKTDAVSHGDDHFFPGPTDICWDLAGAILEWRMTKQLADDFIAAYAGFAQEDPRARLPAYGLAYSLFRMAWCRMASLDLAAQGSDTALEDAARFDAESQYFREMARSAAQAYANGSVEGCAPVTAKR